MNKIFKVIWNPATGNYTVTSETAKSRGKKSGRSKLLISALVAGGMLSSSGTYAEVSLDGGTSAESTPLSDTWIAIGKGAVASSDPILAGTNAASIAIGVQAISGVGSTSLGYKARSTGDKSVALGQLANASGSRGIAIGSAAEATNEHTIAMGLVATASGENAVAIGDHTEATGKNSLTMGYYSKALGEDSLAFGRNVLAGGTGSIAMGAESEATGDTSIAMGQHSNASKVNSIALGSNSAAVGDNAVALGESSSAGGKNSLAFGNQANANGDNSIALGAGSVASTDNTVSVGNGTTQRKIVNMGAGEISTNSTEAINGSQLYTISQSVANRLGGGSDVNANGTINAPSYKLKSGTYNNVGEALFGIDNDTLHWDKNKTAFSASYIIRNADGTIKSTVVQNKIINVADGDISATSTDAINGSQLKATKDDVAANTTSITNLTNDVAGNTTSITNLTNDVADNTTNITNLTDAVDSLGDDSLLWDGTAFSAKHGTDATSKITNVTAGAISATSTDAVNGGQLYGLSSTVADYFGGGAAVSDTGVFTGPTYSINGTDYNSVGDALAAINTSVGTSLGDALLWDNTAGNFSASHGGNASKIANVAAGTLSATSTDAVNGSQLFGISGSVADALGGGSTVNTDGTISAPTYTIANTDYSSISDALGAIDATLDDSLLWDNASGSFSASHGGSASKIAYVAAGEISATSTDAINGSQLNTTNENVAANTTNISNLTTDVATNTTNITNLTDAIDSLGEDAMQWDSVSGSFSAAHGTDTASKITNVAAGELSAASTDAVNGSQLYAANMLINQNSEIINQLAGNTNSTYIEENGAGINYVRTNDTGLTFVDASAAGVGSTAVGYNSVASGESSVAIGQNSSSTIDSGIALGSNSVSNRVILKGSRSTSVTEDGVVIGYDTTDGELLGALSIGDDGKYRQIINVADGSEAHDAVTVRQLQNAIGAVATTPTKYYHANSTAEDSLAVGEDSLAMGAKTIVNGNAGIGIGLNTLVLADAINGIAIGSNARANHADSIAMGNGSQTTRGAQTNYTAYNMDAPQNSVGEFSVGSEDGQRQITNVAAGSADTDAVNVGQLKVTDAQVSQNTQSITNLNTQVTNLDTRVTNIENGIGDIVTTGSTKYFKTNTDGADANAQGKDSVAIGSGSIAAADNSVALGTGSVANEENTISVGSSTNQRRITNVAAGVNATDAVNVSQLKSSEAGGVRYDTKADGSIDYSNITLGGGNSGTTRISNVSAGVNNNDAVNYAQLKQSVQETKQYTDQRMVEMDNKLSKTESKLSGGIASAMAMTGLPQAYTPGASMASIGGGTYNGESAVALGVSMVSANGRWVYKLQGSTNSQGEYSAALGAGIQW